MGWERLLCLKKYCVYKIFIIFAVMQKGVYIVSILLAVILLGSCSGYEKLLKSADYDAQYKAAVNYYENENYGRAKQLFENLSIHFRDKERADSVSWYYANTLMKMENYYMAAYHFNNYYRRYPYSSRAEEALFMSAYCKYKEVPYYSLDQQITKDAIADFEHFVEKYPQSTRIPEVNGYIDEMQSQLEKKEFEIAKGYFKTENYHAAYVSMKNFLNLYPMSQYREEAMYIILRAGYIYASNSREDKMQERLQAVINDFDSFVALFGDSKYLAPSQEIYTRTKALLSQLEEKESKENKK